MAPTITFLGLGNMGTAIAQSLAKAPSAAPVTVWNRTQSRPGVSSAVSAGAIFDPSLPSAVSASQVLIACVLDYTTLRAVLSQLDVGALTGKTFVNITNGTPKEAVNMEAWVRERLGPATYLDGAVMVTPEMIGQPDSFFVVSGESAEKFASVETVFAPAGKAVYLGPSLDAASRFDNAALAAMYGMLAGAFLGMALLKKGEGGGGAEETKDTKQAKAVAPIIGEMVVPALGALLPLITREAESWDAERFNDDAGNSLGMQHRGLMNIVQSLRDDGIDAGVLEAWLAVMKRAIKDGHGEGGSSVLGEYLIGQGP